MSEAPRGRRAGSKDLVMQAQIIHLDRRFDPTSADAEARYDRVARQINRLRAQRGRMQRQADELARQFVEGDLFARTGPRRGQPLSSVGRRKRMRALLALNAELSLLDQQLEGLDARLEQMNLALDAWAKQTYGV